MRIGIIREGKIPPDARVPLSPRQCARIIDEWGIDLVVQRSQVRCFQDQEYVAYGVPLRDDLTDRDVLLGVKEVPVEQLIPDKTYCFFAHVIKKQPYNRKLLRAILDKNIRLYDYEVMTDKRGQRVIAFGYYAGMVGTHNTLWAYAQRNKTFSLPRLKDLHDYKEALTFYQQLRLPPVRVVLTGTGRVAIGAARVLEDMRVKKVSPEAFLGETFDEAVYTQLDSSRYVRRRDGKPFDKQHFYGNPEQHESSFAPYTRAADILINGIFWDRRAPAFFTAEDMHRPDFRIRTIGDITCDIAPESSVPSTIRASSIAAPVYGYDPATGKEAPPYQPHVIDVMAIDNLPSELPRDASSAFGEMFINYVLPEFLQSHSDLLDRAMIAEDGHLGRNFRYLQDYVES